MSKNKIDINKGFVVGYGALAVLALMAGFIVNFSSNLTIDADLLSSGSSCLSSSTVQKIAATSDEQDVFGEKAVAYAVTTRQGNRLKLLIGAKEENRIGGGGIVTFTAGIQNLNDKKYSDKYGRIVLNFKDGNRTKKLDFYYNNPNLELGAWWYKSLSTSVIDYGSSFQAELRNGSNYHFQACISKAINLKDVFGIQETAPSPVPSPSVSPSVSPSPSPSPSPSASASPTLSPSPTVSATPLFSVDIKNGYNAISVDQLVNAQSFINAGMVVFDYNYNGDRKWRQTSKGDNISELYPGTGYYVYYEGPDTKVTFTKNDLVDSEKVFSVKKGWNLLSAPTGGYLKDVKIRVLKEGYVSSCNRTDCTQEKTLKELFEGTASTRKAYAKMYLVSDQNASDAKDAFEVIEINENNLDEIELSDESIFWVYLFDL